MEVTNEAIPAASAPVSGDTGEDDDVGTGGRWGSWSPVAGGNSTGDGSSDSTAPEKEGGGKEDSTWTVAEATACIPVGENGIGDGGGSSREPAPSFPTGLPVLREADLERLAGKY